MSAKEKLNHELKALTVTMLYFGCWIAALASLKYLVLAEYDIPFRGLSLVIVGALVLSKVVLILEHVPLGAWVQTRAAWVDVVARTALYSLGVLVVLLLEKAFEGRHEHGGFGLSLMSVFHHAEIHHVWVNTICLAGALLSFNVLSVVRLHLGTGGLLGLFLSRLPDPRHNAKSRPVSP